MNSPGRLMADPRQLLDLSLTELSQIKIDTVYAASKFTEKVTDAPSSVSIVTGDQIQRRYHDSSLAHARLDLLVPSGFVER